MKTLSLGLALGVMINAVSARADTALRYTSRSKSFNAYNSSVRGDIRTVGMSGATVGLADTFIAGTYNPAGLAMALDNADANFASQTVHDGAVQSYASTLSMNNIGACLNLYPWGLSLGYVAPYSEGETYAPASSPAGAIETSVRTREMHVGFARLLDGDRLSLGADLIVGQAAELINPLGDPSRGGSTTSMAVGGTLGALYQFPGRLLLGLSLSMPMHYSGDTSGQATLAIPGFLKPVDVPGRASLGLGWIPNRFFRADLTTQLVGTTINTALIRDESATVGNAPTFEPHLGIAYTFSDFREFRATVFAGTYYEQSRIEGAPNRMHATWGVELHPWVLTIGWGMDTADSYSSYLASIGVDVVRVMSKFDLIPKQVRPAPAGVLPNPFQLSDEGLARPLNRHWKPIGPDMNPIKVGLDVPGRLKNLPETFPEAVRQSGKDLEETGKDVLDTVKGVPTKLKELVEPDRQ